MRCRVNIFGNNNEFISSEIWHGKDIDEVRYWVELAIKDIVRNTHFHRVYYDIIEIL